MVNFDKIANYLLSSKSLNQLTNWINSNYLYFFGGLRSDVDVFVMSHHNAVKHVKAMLFSFGIPLRIY